MCVSRGAPGLTKEAPLYLRHNAALLQRDFLASPPTGLAEPGDPDTSTVTPPPIPTNKDI